MRVLYYFVLILERAFSFAIFARIILSWIPANRDSPLFARVYRVIYEVTEPILGPIRRIIPPISGFDLSPMIALILVEMVGSIILRFL